MSSGKQGTRSGSASVLHVVLIVISSFHITVIRLYSICFGRAVLKSAFLATTSTLHK